MSARTSNDYRTKAKPTWCEDCGDYNVLESITTALAELNIEPHNVITTAGVGCASRSPFYLNAYSFHTVHGRGLPAAIGVKAVTKGKTVIALGGDGDGFSIGGNHFVHTSRKNPDMTYICMDNEIYGLTKGQNSPTSHEDLQTKINPYQVLEDRINPVLMALSFNTTFIARGFSEDKEDLTEMIKKGIKHKGFSFIHVLSPCTQFNPKVTFESLRNRMAPLPENHNTADRITSMKYAMTSEPLYMGVFYDINRPTLQDRLADVREMALEEIGNPSEYRLEDVVNRFA